MNYSTGSPPAVRGRIRVVPEDFQVVEDLGFSPDGAGEHGFLRVRKRGANTDWVARQIAAFAGVRPAAVSYAGLKDRHGVTEQWFSVHLPGRVDPDWSGCGHDQFTVLEYARHSRKLRRGALKGNAFRIVIRDLEGNAGELEQGLSRIVARGVPNYFGEQRFGHEGGNLNRAEAMFQGRERVKDRHKRSLYLSAARAEVFNRLLSRRVAEGKWDQPLAGDVMMLEGSHSIFLAETVDDEIRQRVATWDIHPTGPLWGRGDPFSRGEVLVLEQKVVGELLVLCQGLEKAGLKQERRSLRLRVGAADLESVSGTKAVLRFWLPAGSYATSVLRELIL